jgi:proteic killer suppression protein
MNKFKDDQTRQLFEGKPIKGFPFDLMRKAIIKLTMVEAAINISELATPPSNCLEKLSGKRADQWSIRVNNKYRICFNWHNGRACNIEFVDYH